MQNKKITAVIPARMQSSRFPGKPLAKILDLPMIEHVRRRTCLAKLIDEVYVATCDKEIKDIVEASGGKAIMTSNTHQRCTDRVEEAAKHLNADVVVIVSGDEPLFIPELIDSLAEPMLSNDKITCINLLSRILSQKDLSDQDVVKAVLSHDNCVLYFSRASIPFLRREGKTPMFRQTGLSAFGKEFLHKFSNMKPTPLEIAESIDFLRILEQGHSILGIIYEQTTIGVDRPSDIERVEKILRENPHQQNLYQQILKR